MGNFRKSSAALELTGGSDADQLKRLTRTAIGGRHWGSSCTVYSSFEGSSAISLVKSQTREPLTMPGWMLPGCTCLMLCLFASGGKKEKKKEKKGKRENHYTREISKASFKVVAMINRAAACETFINICYASTPNRPGALWSDSGPLRTFGKQANLNTPHFLWRAIWPTPWGKFPDKKKKSENYQEQTYCDLWINEDKCTRQQCCAVSRFTPDNGVCQCWWWKITPQRQSYSLILKPCLVSCSLWCSLRLLPGGSITPH